MSTQVLAVVQCADVGTHEAGTKAGGAYAVFQGDEFEQADPKPAADAMLSQVQYLDGKDQEGRDDEESGQHDDDADLQMGSEETRSSIKEAEMTSDDEALDYASQGSELSALLEEELQQVECEVLSVPDQGWMEVTDNILEEDGDVSMDTSPDQVENEKVQCGEDPTGDEVKSGADFLQQIDKDYLCSPRLVVRGVYSGEVLTLIVRRNTEGTYVALYREVSVAMLKSGVTEEITFKI